MVSLWFPDGFPMVSLWFLIIELCQGSDRLEPRAVFKLRQGTDDGRGGKSGSPWPMATHGPSMGDAARSEADGHDLYEVMVITDDNSGYPYDFGKLHISGGFKHLCSCSILDMR